LARKLEKKNQKDNKLLVLLMSSTIRQNKEILQVGDQKKINFPVGFVLEIVKHKSRLFKTLYSQ